MRLTIPLVGSLVWRLCFSADAPAQRPRQSPESPPAAMKLKVGDQAPDFAVPRPGRPANSDEMLRLSDYRGKRNVALAFYPRAFTGGCTAQMCGYRDDYAGFRKAGVEVIAISLDKQELNDRFKIEYKLPFPVLGDPEMEIAKAYGVPTMNAGGSVMAQRTTFLIDKQGVIRLIFPKYDIKKDGAALRDAVRVLSGAQPAEGESGYPAFVLPADVEMKNDIVFGRGGELELLGDLFVPKNKPLSGPMPAIVYIHGGGWRKGDRSFMHRIAAHLAQRGVAGFSIEYRLSDVAIYPAQIHDCKAAIRWLRANAKSLNVAPDRIGVLGDSAGAHLAAMMATTGDVPEFEGDGGNPGISTKVQAAVLFYGVYDLPALARSKLAGLAKLFLGATLDEAPDLYEQASPIEHVSSTTPPCLALYGDRDSPLVIDGSEGFAKALRKAGVPVEVEVAKGQEHSYALTAKDLAPLMRPVEAFLAKRFGVGDQRSGKPESPINGN